MTRRTVSLGALLCLAALVGHGCGTSSTGGIRRDGDVHPFDEIRASALVFEPDATDPTRGIFHVTTTEPAICAIVWGLDGNFGRFNNSLSMNGTGIAQHDVILPDVKPGETYSYIVEGATADGTLYRSDVGTFRIDRIGEHPAIGATSVPGPNITSKAKVSDVSSEFSAAFAGSNAIDGDPATEWATKGDGDHGSITLDFGDAIDVAGVEFVTRSMADGTSTTSTYTVSVDGAPPLGPFPSGTVANPHLIAFVARGRLIRFDVASSTGGNVGAVEVRVFG